MPPRLGASYMYHTCILYFMLKGRTPLVSFFCRASPMSRWLLSFRILLPVLPAAARCFKAQPMTNGHGASEHLRTQVTAAELFYLRHLRTCAASSTGARSTCSAAAPWLCISGLLVVLDCIMLLAKVILQDVLHAYRMHVGHI